MQINLKDWTLVISNGAWLVGKLRGDVLHEVLELHHHIVPTPGGGVTAAMLITPFLMIGLDSIDIPEGALKRRLDAFGMDGQWKKLISDAVDMRMNIRAQASGLVLPGNGAH